MDFRQQIRAKNRTYNRLEPLAYREQLHRTEGRPIPPALAHDLERARRDYARAVAVIRRHQAARLADLAWELEAQARQWARVRG
jgi:hypothetical protein